MPCIPDQERSGVLCRYRHQGIRGMVAALKLQKALDEFGGEVDAV